MNIWAIVPVKPLNRAKSRLAAVLTPEQRQVFAEKMFRHSLEVLQTVEHFGGLLVVSRDTKVLSIAREYGVHTVLESGAPELNVALARASQAVITMGGEGVLVLPADVPFVNREDVNGILSLARYHASVVIVPDNNEDGTNALLMTPPGYIPFSFGPGSFRRHMTLAEQAHATIEIYRSSRLGLDIDTPEDLAVYRRSETAPIPIPVSALSS